VATRLIKVPRLLFTFFSSKSYFYGVLNSNKIEGKKMYYIKVMDRFANFNLFFPSALNQS